MVIDYGMTGGRRKELVQALSQITGEKAKYQGTPSCAYKVGDFIVTRQGGIEGDITRELIEKLKARGYRPRGDIKEPAEDLSYLRKEEKMMACVPREMLTDEETGILRDYVESKKTILKHMFKADDLPIEDTGETLNFAWFPPGGEEEQEAYIDFIEKLCEFAKTISEVHGKDYEVQNERYHGRYLLLRLGFIGKQYALDRQILLQNLPGNAAYRDGPSQAFRARPKKDAGRRMP